MINIFLNYFVLAWSIIFGLILISYDRFYYVVIIMLLSFLIYRLLESFLTSRDSRAVKNDWTLWLTSIIYFVLILLGYVEFISVKILVNPIITICGVILAVSSSYLRRLCIKTLSDQWSIYIIETNLYEYSLLKIGPYKRIRHPIYLSYILDIISVVLILNSYYTLILSLILLPIVYGFRVKREEIVMRSRFGVQYDDYVQGTKRFVPFIY
jgi:protein-S-isoprenylcysteine O-methyltransferase Ste14